MPSPSRSDRSRRTRWLGILAAAAALGLAVFGASALRSAGEDSARGLAPADGWTFAPAMTHRRSYTASAESGGKIYVASGMVGQTGTPLDLFERFDPLRQTWAPLPSLPAAFSAGAAASLDGRIYVLGGNSKEATGRQVYTYDIQQRRWAGTTPLPAPRTNHASVSLGGKLYVLGGLDPVHPTSSVFVYEPRTRRWSRTTPLPRALHALGAVAFRGEIWALGGRGPSGIPSRQVWVYDPEHDRWRAGPTMPKPVEILGATVVGDRIHAVFESTYLIYDARAARWSLGPSLRVPRHALAVFDVAGQLYAIGGCTVPQLQDSTLVETIRAAE